MSRKNGNTHNTKRWAIVEKDYWNGIAVGWRDIPPFIFDAIPPELIYNIPHLHQTGIIEDRSVIYLGECDESEMEDMIEMYGNVHEYPIPDLNIEIIIPDDIF